MCVCVRSMPEFSCFLYYLSRVLWYVIAEHLSWAGGNGDDGGAHERRPDGPADAEGGRRGQRCFICRLHAARSQRELL